MRGETWKKIKLQHAFKITLYIKNHKNYIISSNVFPIFELFQIIRFVEVFKVRICLSDDS